MRLNKPELLDVLQERLVQVVNKAWDAALIEVDSLAIYEGELKPISALPSRQLRRLAFTILVLGKYAMVVKCANAAWINIPEAELFQLANVNVRHDDRNLLLNDLYQLGMIRFGSAVDNTSIEALYVQNFGEPVFSVPIMRDIGYQYEARIDPSRFRRCVICGLPVPMRQRGKADGLCPHCKQRTSRHVVQLCEDCGRPYLSERRAKRNKCPDCYDKCRRETNRIVQAALRAQSVIRC